ncbi:MAG: hypothetical protein QM831_01790 [Kofleriaceae bacterium]
MTAPDEVVSAWDATVANWDDPKTHDALLAKVASYNCFAWAAGQYKSKAGDPIADKQLERLRKAATATLLATASVRPDDTKMPYRNAILILIALVILMVVGAVYAKLHQKPDAPETMAQPR